MSKLFERDRTVIGRHIRNIFNEGELNEKVACANFAHTTQHGAIKGKIQKSTTTVYNLDVIISVGYRVKSKQGTQFRQWANSVLKEHLIKGYSINKKRLETLEKKVSFIHSGIQIISRAIEEKANDEGFGYLNFFAKGLELLDDYDHETLDKNGLTNRAAIHPKEEDYRLLLNAMRKEFQSSIFGLEKDEGFKSAIAQISI